MTTAVATRNATGLVDVLFDAIDALNQKKIDPEHARAISHTAKSIVSIAQLELEARKLQQAEGAAELKSLTIDQSPPAEA